MKPEIHLIQVDENTHVSSIWLIPEHYRKILIIAHGAGKDMNSPFVSALHEGLANHNILTVKFKFPYLEQGRKAPDRPAMLLSTWRAIVNAGMDKTGMPAEKIFLSGKSMGGRYASMLATESPNFGGVILYGYPLHPPGKPDKPRFDHIPAITCPLLFIQGTRDNLCRLGGFKKLIDELPAKPFLQIIEGGEHSFKVLKRLGRDE